MKKTIITLMTICLIGSVFANNISVTNVSLTGQNVLSNTTLINFDVSWENSWRTSTNESNYDGAWVFVKFKKNGTPDWRHCTIDATGTTFGSGDSIKVTSDGKGAFVYRNSNGIGNVAFIGNQLRWDYGIDNVLDNDSIEIEVFALEMVYIPTESFFLGSGGTENYYFKDGNTPNPFLVTNAGPITIGNLPGQLNFNTLGSVNSISATFPNGYDAFWIMKYECSQQQYADFLNHLDQAKLNVLNTSSSNFTDFHPHLTPIQADRAINQMTYIQNMALADWSGLRPISEMEFEKACRGGNIAPVPNEFSWGSTQITQLLTLNNTGQPNETIASPIDANAVYSLSNGNIPVNHPVRVGLFARSTGSSRELSGSTYYGVMNMSDNLHEITIFSGSNDGQLISKYVHGDGYLNSTGNTDILYWTNSTAFGLRGGGYNNGNSGTLYMRVSDRTSAASTTVPIGSTSSKGIRLARTAE